MTASFRLTSFHGKCPEFQTKIEGNLLSWTSILVGFYEGTDRDILDRREEVK